ncbi:MAG TPA: hypothetical protein VFG47_00355, partial [Geminicoccaceae bacterium]|nr:hypothetical protein [Geminicoccaceae bacterium]
MRPRPGTAYIPAMSDAALAPAAPPRPAGASSAPPRGNAAALAVAGALFAALLAAVADQQGWRQAALLLVGGALGLVLYHAAFGFTSAWRAFIADRRGAGLRAQ